MDIKRRKYRLFFLFLTRASSAAGTILLSLLVPYFFGVEDSSDFFIGIGVLYVLGIVSRFGFDLMLLKEGVVISRSEVLIERKVILYFFIPALMSLLMVGFYYLILSTNSGYKKYEWVLLSIPAFTTVGMISFCLKAVGDDIVAAAFELGSISLVTSVLMLLGFFFGFVLDPGCLYIYASWFVLTTASIYTFIRVKGVVEADYSINREFSHSVLFLTNQLSSYLTQWYPIFMLGSLDAKLTVYYTVANRVAGVISFVGVTIDSYVAPRYSRYWKEEKIEPLICFRREMNKIAMVLAGIVFLLVFSFAVGNGLINQYEGLYYFIAAMLIFSYSASVALGPNGFLLMMTGRSSFVTMSTLIGCFFVIVSTSVMFYFEYMVLSISIAAIVPFLKACVFRLEANKGWV